MQRSEVGRTGEAVAARWLEERGWRIVDRNVRYREGEIDIVAERSGVLAFVEVKARRTTAFGAPAEAVTRAKARRIRTMGARYLIEHRPQADVIRFDVMDLLGDGTSFRVRHIESAF